jgi:hypothetical protein
MLVMAVIVTTALFLPVGALLALLVFALLRISLSAFVTFGGALNAPEGLLAWWAIFLLPALVYAAYAMPWHRHEPPG